MHQKKWNQFEKDWHTSKVKPNQTKTNDKAPKNLIRFTSKINDRLLSLWFCLLQQPVSELQEIKNQNKNDLMLCELYAYIINIYLLI